MIVLIIYIIFAVINIIVCSILIYLDYNDGIEITLGNIYTIFSIVIFSLFGTIWLIINFLNKSSDIIILQKKK